MFRFLVVIVVIFIIFVIFRQLGTSTSRRGQPTTFPYKKQNALFSPTERSFLGVLESVVQGRYRVFGKVRLAAVLAVDGGLTASARASAFNRIAQKHVDFLLCEPSTLAVIAVIELDDQSHQRPDRQARDGFLDAACTAAGVVLIRYPVRAAYTAAEVNEGLSRVGLAPVVALPSATGRV